MKPPTPTRLGPRSTSNRGTENDGVHGPRADGAESPEVARSKRYDLAVGGNAFEAHGQVRCRGQMDGIAELAVLLAAVMDVETATPVSASWRSSVTIPHMARGSFIDSAPRWWTDAHAVNESMIRTSACSRATVARILCREQGMPWSRRRTDADDPVVNGAREPVAPQARRNDLRGLVGRSMATDGFDCERQDGAVAANALPLTAGGARGLARSRSTCRPTVGLAGNDGDAARPGEVRDALIGKRMGLASRVRTSTNGCEPVSEERRRQPAKQPPGWHRSEAGNQRELAC